MDSKSRVIPSREPSMKYQYAPGRAESGAWRIDVNRSSAEAVTVANQSRWSNRQAQG